MGLSLFDSSFPSVRFCLCVSVGLPASSQIILFLLQFHPTLPGGEEQITTHKSVHLLMSSD